MGEKMYYLVEILIFTFLAIYFITKPQDILKLFKQEGKKELYMVVRVIGVIIAVGNIVLNLDKLLQ